MFLIREWRRGDGARRPGDFPDRRPRGRHPEGRAQAAPRAVERDHARQAARGLARRRAVLSRQAAPVPVTERPPAARLRRAVAAPVRRSAPGRRGRRAERRAAHRRAREHHREPAAGRARRIPPALSRCPRRADDRYQRFAGRRADGTQGRCGVRCGGAGRQERRGAAVVPRTAADHLARGPCADHAAAGRAERLGDRVPERLRLPACADALARRQAPRVDPRARPELVPRDRCVRGGRHRHRLPAVHAEIVTPLVWRAGEVPSALAALHDELRARSRAAARDRSAQLTGSSRASRSTA